VKPAFYIKGAYVCKGRLTFNCCFFDNFAIQCHKVTANVHAAIFNFKGFSRFQIIIYETIKKHKNNVASIHKADNNTSNMSYKPQQNPNKNSLS